MRAILSEKNVVIILFVMVFIVFSFAHEDSKKMEKLYFNSSSAIITPQKNLTKTEIKKPDAERSLSIPANLSR